MTSDSFHSTNPSSNPFEVNNQTKQQMIPLDDEYFDAFGINHRNKQDATSRNHVDTHDITATKCCLPKHLIPTRKSRNRNRLNRPNKPLRQERSKSRGRRSKRSTINTGNQQDQAHIIRNNTQYDDFTTADTFDNEREEDEDVHTELPSNKKGDFTSSTRITPLDDIPTAVKNLAIEDYPKMAEYRATIILKHWILDKGLYDELANLNNLLSSHNLSCTESFSVQSVMSQEGMEVGAHGFPMEGLERLDTEIDTLRERMQRDLSIVNARLGTNTVAAADDDDEFHVDEKQLSDHLQLLDKYPHIQRLITCRHHFRNVLAQVDTFCEIPTICDRLFREMSNEPLALHRICQEHNDLQFFLIQVEAELKDRMDDLVVVATHGGGRSQKPDHNRNHKFVPSFPNHGGVDQLLLEPVKLVWGLSHRLQHRLLERIKNIHLMSNEELVAVAESVEAYEQTWDESCRLTPHPGVTKRARLQVSPMRQMALHTLLRSFESRCYQVMQASQEQAANDARSQDGGHFQFNAILEAATLLMDQIDVIQNNAELCVPAYWQVTALWMLCVATVCSQFILQRIGGQEGNNLEYMTVTQLLDLLSWIEQFENKVKEAFPQMARDRIRKTRFVSGTELLADKEINGVSTNQSLTSVLYVLWDSHRLTQDEFMVRTQFQTSEWLANVYKADHEKAQISGGRLITSLPEDVWALARVQLETIEERLPKYSTVLVDAASVIFHQMQLQQRQSRDMFLVDLETCCAAANDLLRMTELTEQTLSEFQKSSSLSEESLLTLEAVTDELIRQYSNDAVFSAQSVHTFIFEALEEDLAGKLFEFEWEDKTYNEMAMTIVRTIDDFLHDIEQWMDAVMVRKSIYAMVKGCVNFYVRHLMLKAAKRRKAAVSSCFQNDQRALQRMAGDIKVFQDFFEEMVAAFPPLARIIENEFEVLENVFGLFAIASGFDKSAPEDFLLVIQKHTRNLSLTRYLAAGIWKVMNPSHEEDIQIIMDENSEQLKALEVVEDQISQEHKDPTLELSDVLQGVAEETKRGRPILKAKLKANAVEKMKKMKDVMKNLRRERGDRARDNKV